MKKLVLLVAIAVTATALNSCKKEKEDEKDTYDNSSAPESNAVIENAYDEMTNMSDQAVNGTMVYYKMDKITFVTPEEYRAGVFDKVDCNTVISVDTINSPHSITIDWGTTNCTCNDGKQRRGKIVTTFTGHYRDPGTVITHTPQNYYVNDNRIDGSKTVENMGLNSSNQPYFNVSVNGTVTMTNADVFTYSSSRVRTWTAGFSTPLFFSDDEYDITGTATASSTNGNGYTANTTNPIHIKVGCPFITSGTLEITPNNKPLRIIDYGGGTCDATFTITINGVTYTVH